MLWIALAVAPHSAPAQSYVFETRLPSTAAADQIDKARGAALLPDGSVWIADEDDSLVHRFDSTGTAQAPLRQVDLLSGPVELDEPVDLHVTAEGVVYILDRGARRVFVLGDSPETSYAFGQKGGDYGFFDSVVSLSVDPGGYVYVLDEDQQYVAVFAPRGQFETWIRGGRSNFDGAVATGTNGAGELYVLEQGGPDVHILDRTGRVLFDHSGLNSRPGVSIGEASDLLVLGNGDFLVVDRDDSRMTHFARDGEVLGTFGGSGTPGNGVFAEAAYLTADPVQLNRIGVVDADAKQVQTFRVPAAPDTTTYTPPRLGIRPSTAKVMPFRDRAYAPDGTTYTIPLGNDQTVIASAPGDRQPIFSLQVEEARALALDGDGQLYVLDTDEKRVLVYDRRNGSLVRKFGSDLPQELDEPVDLVTLSDGTLLVADQKTGAIHRWNSKGVYQGVSTPGPDRQQEPAALAVDADDRLYVWDVTRNGILRIDAHGKELEGPSILHLRGEEVRGERGTVLGLEVDPLGQVHTFNETVQEYAVFDWSNGLTPRLRYGRPGEEAHSFDDVEGFSVNPYTFDVHVLVDGGDRVRTFQLAVRPPRPQGPLAFGAAADTLIVHLPEPDSPVVSGFGLIRRAPDGTLDTLEAAPTLPLTVPPAAEPPADNPVEYAAVHYSPTDVSAPTDFFTDYFGHGNRLFAAGQPDAALQAYRAALAEMGDSTSMRAAVAGRFAELAAKRADDGRVDAAASLLQAASELADEGSSVATALSGGYAAQLRALARAQAYDRLLRTAESATEVLSQPAASDLFAVVDSVGVDLRATERVEAREQAVAYYQALLNWGAPAAPTQHALAESQWAAYRIKKRTGAPSYEQNVTLDQAVRSAEKSVRLQSTETEHFHAANLLYLDVLQEQGDYDRVVTQSTDALETRTVPMSGAEEKAYRIAQAEGYRGRGDVEEAAGVYRRLKGEYPDDDDLSLRLAGVLVDVGSYDEAKLLYQRLLTEQGESAELIMRLGTLEQARGNFSEASLQLEKALKMDPDLPGVHAALAKAYDGASNFQKAVEHYEAAIRRMRGGTTGQTRLSDAGKSDLNAALSSLARIHMQLGAYDAAVGVYTELTQAAPSDADAWLGLGSASMNAGLVYQALSALNRASNLEPGSETINQQMVRARAMRDEVQANRPPAEIVSASINALYPSLYRNYADVAQLPIGEAILANNTSLPMRNVRLTVYVPALMSEPTEQSVNTLPAFTNQTVPLSAVFGESILDRTQQETFQVQLALTYRHDGRERTVEATPRFTLYGRNAIKWQDRRRLAAFVAPQDEEMINYVKAVDRVFAGAPSYSLPQPLIQAMRAWATLETEGLTYSVDPQTDFSVVSEDPTQLDFLQFQEETLQRGAGDCDDLVALYVSLLENAGVSTAYVDLPGHVMAAVNTGLSAPEWRAAGFSSEQGIEQFGTVWVLIEATYLDGRSFLEAWRQGVARYRKAQDDGQFPEIVSLSDAHTVYEPAAYTPDGEAPVPPADTTALLNTYQEAFTAVYRQTTETRRETLSERYRRDSTNAVVANELAILEARSGDLDRAANLYRTLIDAGLADALVHNNYGNVLFRQGKIREAVSAYERSAALDPEDARVHVNRARAYVQLGQSGPARAAFQQALGLDASIRAAYTDLAERLQVGP